MRVFAYCAASFEKSVRRAAGVPPLLSPPCGLTAFNPHVLEGYDLLYFKLHGLPGQPYWYGDHWLTALSADQVSQADLSGAVVFVANCYLPESPLLQALLDAGAKAVVGGPGQNYGRPHSVDGADLLGLYFRYCLQLKLPTKVALTFAKHRLRLKRKDKSTKDTLAFQLWTKEKTYG